MKNNNKMTGFLIALGLVGTLVFSVFFLIERPDCYDGKKGDYVKITGGFYQGHIGIPSRSPLFNAYPVVIAERAGSITFYRTAYVHKCDLELLEKSGAEKR